LTTNALLFTFCFLYLPSYEECVVGCCSVEETQFLIGGFRLAELKGLRINEGCNGGGQEEDLDHGVDHRPDMNAPRLAMLLLIGRISQDSPTDAGIAPDQHEYLRSRHTFSEFGLRACFLPAELDFNFKGLSERIYLRGNLGMWGHGEDFLKGGGQSLTDEMERLDFTA